jgi:haloalkane dehalogenase
MSRIIRADEDERFRDLAGWPYAPRYLEIADPAHGALRMHYVDEGPSDGAIVLLLHGEPTWGFLYRKMIPPLVAAGRRVIAPDLIGFGRSDKLAERGDYSFASHARWLRAFIDALPLRDITLFCQDWGGLLGLRLVGEDASPFARVVASNTWLPTGDTPPGDAFLKWQRYSQQVSPFDAGQVVRTATRRPVSDAAVAAYNAPFPDESHCAGARAFPMLVPVTPDDPAAAANRLAWHGLRRFERPFLTAFADSDPVTSGADRHLQRLIPGAHGQAHVTIANAGHFVQEDAGEELGDVILRFMHETGRRAHA